MGKPVDTDESGGSRPGTLDDGFNLIAKDLDRAFCLGLSTNQAVILNSVREQSWTASLLARRKGEPRPQPVPATLNLTHLAADSGLNRSRLSVALKALIAAEMLGCTEGGYLIKKDYSRWLDDDGKAPRFNPAQLRFIRAAKTPKKGLRIAEIDTQLPLQSATPGDEMNGQIQTQLPLQSATVNERLPLPNATATVALCNSSRCALQQRDTVVERTAEDLLDSEICALPGGARTREAPNLRDPGDLALVREAMTLLGASPNTEHLALEVGRVHNSSTNVSIPGWKWVVAAYAACRTAGQVGDDPMRWNYFFAIVRGAGKGEYDRIRAEAGAGTDPARSGGPAPGRKPTQAERRKAETEAIRRSAARIRAEEEGT